MAEYALSTDLYTFEQVTQGFFAWRSDAGKGEIIKELAPRNVFIPKFAKSPVCGMTEGGSSGSEDGTLRRGDPGP